MPSLNTLALLVLEISAFTRKDGQECILFIWSETPPSTCFILSDESSIPFYSTSNGYNKRIGYSRWPVVDGKQPSPVKDPKKDEGTGAAGNLRSNGKGPLHLAMEFIALFLWFLEN